MAEREFTKNYEYRLRTNRAFVTRADEVLEESRRFYNAALAHRINAYKSEGKTITR